MSENSELIPSGESKHNYTNRGKPFKWGDRMVQMATEVVGRVDATTDNVRKIIIDCETGEEVKGPIDIGSHVVHPEPGGPYVIYRVVDEGKSE